MQYAHNAVQWQQNQIIRYNGNKTQFNWEDQGLKCFARKKKLKRNLHFMHVQFSPLGFSFVVVGVIYAAAA